jgi:hypothetical protein
MFLHTADYDYVGARSAFFDSHHNLFWWLSAQAIEKYLKAILLLNDISVKGFGHKILEMFQNLYNIDKRIIIPEVSSREIFHSNDLMKTTNKSFILKLVDYGSPDNRYNIIGYDSMTEDLLHLDNFVYHLRRLCVALKSKIHRDIEISWLDMILESPNYWKFQADYLEDLMRLSEKDRLRCSFVQYNVAFFPSAPTEIKRIQRSHFGSPLGLWIDYIEECDPRTQVHQDALVVLQQVLDNIQLPKDLRKDLIELTTRRRQPG